MSPFESVYRSLLLAHMAGIGCTLTFKDCEAVIDRVREYECEQLLLTAELARLRSEREWIPVSTRLPELNRLVNVICEYEKETFVSSSYHHGNNRWSVYGVTHWMPLPPPPTADICKTCGGTREVYWDYDDPISESVVKAVAECPDCKTPPTTDRDYGEKGGTQ